MRGPAPPGAAAVVVALSLLASPFATPLATPPALAGKGDEGLALATGDFSLKLGVFVQTEFTYLDGQYTYSGDYFQDFADTGIDPRGDFLIRNARLALSGRALLPILTYVVELDGGQVAALPGENPASRDPRLTDAYVNLHLNELAGFRVGQFKVPFGLFNLMNERYEMFPQQPAGSEQLDPGRDLGLMYFGSTLERQLNWHLSVTNGGGSNKPRNDNSDMAYAMRVEWQNKGGFKYRATAIDHPDRLQYTAGLAYLRNERNPDGAAATDETGDGCLPGVSPKCAYPSRGETALEVFGALRGRRFQANATCQKWTYEDAALDAQDPRLANPADLDVTYCNVDAGYFLTDTIEVIGRYGKRKNDGPHYFWTGDAWTDADQAADPLNIGFAGATDVVDDDVRLGGAWYLSGANLKLVFDYGWTRQTVDKNDTLEPDPRGSGRASYRVSGARVLLSFFI